MAESKIKKSSFDPNFEVPPELRAACLCRRLGGSLGVGAVAETGRTHRVVVFCRVVRLCVSPFPTKKEAFGESSEST